MARGGVPASPLPPRHGVDAQRFRMPQGGPWESLRDHLVERLAVGLTAQEVDRMLAAGEFVDSAGRPVPADAPFVPRSVVWAHRDLPEEHPPPSDVEVLHRDERIVVVDKPHHMSTMPRGRHVVHSALARTRVLTGLPRLAPAHRLDRPTAGVLLLTTEQRWRGAYQQLFAAGLVHKTYLAVAPVRADLDLPLVRRTHLVKEHGAHQAREVAGEEPNAETLVELVDTAGGLGLYRLTPRTGRTHQLRCQLSGLGIPITGDPLYPLDRAVADDDFSDPLQLLAAELAFDDPVDGRPRRFVSQLRLKAWPGPWPSPSPVT
ncbi:pseudouridine synthase [Humibacillus xanthopallidus]|uniref:RNA pseudouridylate synthase n=1 Tax=Humibacillus xanthopallidus TaxID=412689 RepID=A0A543HJB2_9MICO|nr:pseudouridine synthase [Humibacillus xanthopallidus]TQM58423.1 tRNA pseudouridine32 synthase/23S rRNA pseudouridine746 synthase [Humibacillus xanthopallidus]